MVSCLKSYSHFYLILCWCLVSMLLIRHSDTHVYQLKTLLLDSSILINIKLLISFCQCSIFFSVALWNERKSHVQLKMYKNSWKTKPLQTKKEKINKQMHSNLVIFTITTYHSVASKTHSKNTLKNQNISFTTTF